MRGLQVLEHQALQDLLTGRADPGMRHPDSFEIGTGDINRRTASNQQGVPAALTAIGNAISSWSIPPMEQEVTRSRPSAG
jgi:hypothetical protein